MVAEAQIENAKSETRNPKFETNPKSESRDMQNQHDWAVSRPCVSRNSNLFRISGFEFRVSLGLSRGAVGRAPNLV
jgi:hypothetical protein